VLSQDRTNLMGQIRDAARGEAEALGVQIIDVRLTRTDLPEQNLTATYARMRAERAREAADEIARGGEAAQRVRATADRTVVELTSDARRRSEIVRGEADAQRNAIYAQAFGQDPEFFAFTRSMTAYERALRGQNSSLVINPEGEFFSYLGAGGNPNGVSPVAVPPEVAAAVPADAPSTAEVAAEAAAQAAAAAEAAAATAARAEGGAESEPGEATIAVPDAVGTVPGLEGEPAAGTDPATTAPADVPAPAPATEAAAPAADPVATPAAPADSVPPTN